MRSLKVLTLGDIVGLDALRKVRECLPRLRRQLQVDWVIANGENIAGGFGLKLKHYDTLREAGVDVVTLGNHAYDQSELKNAHDNWPERLLRPLNYPLGCPGKGKVSLQGIDPQGIAYKIIVMQIMGRAFFPYPIDNPFTTFEMEFMPTDYAGPNQLVLVDFHAEAGSEKMAFACEWDGRLSALWGTHTHIPTADIRVLRRGTAYQSDLGMCGAYYSVLGFNPHYAIERFKYQLSWSQTQTSQEPITLSGAVLTFDLDTGLAVEALPFSYGGDLVSTHPEFEFD